MFIDPFVSSFLHTMLKAGSVGKVVPSACVSPITCMHHPITRAGVDTELAGVCM